MLTVSFFQIAAETARNFFYTKHFLCGQMKNEKFQNIIYFDGRVKYVICKQVNSSTFSFTKKSYINFFIANIKQNTFHLKYFSTQSIAFGKNRKVRNVRIFVSSLFSFNLQPNRLFY